MFISNRDVLITSVEEKKLQDGTPYHSIKFVNMDDKEQYTVSSKDESIYGSLQEMSMYNLNLNLINSKYGMRLSISSINKDE